MALYLTITQTKGGVGKTATALHLAAWHSRKGANVVVVDCDINRSAIKYARRGDDQGLPFAVVDIRSAAKATRSADVVISDTRASAEQEELESLAEGSDLIVIPCPPEAGAYEDMLEMTQLLNRLQVPYIVLVNRIPPANPRKGDDLKSGLVAAGVAHLSTVIREYDAYRKAELAGVPVYDARTDDGRPDAKRNIAWSDYDSAARELQEHLEAIAGQS